jgi:hypothetical protein
LLDEAAFFGAGFFAAGAVVFFSIRLEF